MEQKKNYHAIDLTKFICSILVIVVHTAPLLNINEDYNWLLIAILGRFVVPFFFISTAYFISLNTQKYGDFYFKTYIRSLIKTYLIWSIIYLPLGIDYIGKEFSIPFFLYPIALIVALVYIGTYFHLWYIPALILALCIVHWAMKHFRKRYILTISFLLILLGSLETYYGFIHTPFILNIVDRYFGIFITTRNGIFFGLFYVAWGYFIAQKDAWIHKTHHHGSAMTIFFVLMVLEAFIIHGTNNLDSNILLMAAPFTICLFLYCRDVSLSWNLNYQKLRAYGSLYYFTHAYFLILIPFFLQIFQKQSLYEGNGIFRFFSVLLCTHLVSSLIYRVQVYRKEKQERHIHSRT